MSKKLDVIHHVAIQVEDVKQARAWYERQFKVNVLYEDDSWVLLEFANTKLALVVPGEHPPHIAVEREDIDSLGTVKCHRDGTESVYINDTHNNIVELIRDPNGHLR